MCTNGVLYFIFTLLYFTLPHFTFTSGLDLPKSSLGGKQYHIITYHNGYRSSLFFFPLVVFVSSNYVCMEF
ncbi:hypothetical protein BZA77DRAFT_305848 [Pyronema omphalodes]|nr:hypothetical protein BZA77DRAFT_305848 [Pyronema omphalodes]